MVRSTDAKAMNPQTARTLPECLARGLGDPHEFWASLSYHCQEIGPSYPYGRQSRARNLVPECDSDYPAARSYGQAEAYWTDPYSPHQSGRGGLVGAPAVVDGGELLAEHIDKTFGAQKKSPAAWRGFGRGRWGWGAGDRSPSAKTIHQSVLSSDREPPIRTAPGGTMIGGALPHPAVPVSVRPVLRFVRQVIRRSSPTAGGARSTDKPAPLSDPYAGQISKVSARRPYSRATASKTRRTSSSGSSSAF